MRLIDADEMRNGWIDGINETIYCANDVLDDIDEQPTVDAVEVVRCEDCRFSQYDLEEQGYMEPPACDGMWCERDKTQPVKMDFTDYCSYGERREK